MFLSCCCISNNFDPDITESRKEIEREGEKGKEEEDEKEIKEKEEVLIYLDRYGKVGDVFINLNGMFVMVDKPEENSISREVLKNWFEDGSPKTLLYDTLLSIEVSNFSSSSFSKSKNNLNVKKILKLEHKIKKDLHAVTFAFDVVRNIYSPKSYKVFQ